MRIKLIILFIITIFSIIGCRKQGIEPVNTSYFIKYYGEGVHDGIYKAKQTADDGYILVGYTQENSADESTRDAYVFEDQRYWSYGVEKNIGGRRF